MNKSSLRRNGVLLVMSLSLAVVSARFASQVASAEPPPPPAAQAAAPSIQQFPVMDMVANKLIQKYQTSTCKQLWQQKSQQNKPKTAQQQEAINLLRGDPQMRAAFINTIAAPIANKMFDCGMIP